MTSEVRRAGKHTIRVGDTVRVAGARLELINDRGWSGARVLRFVDTPRGLYAEVSGPIYRGEARGTRTVAVDRLTRTRQERHP